MRATVPIHPEQVRSVGIAGTAGVPVGIHLSGGTSYVVVPGLPALSARDAAALAALLTVAADQADADDRRYHP